ncbi:hypothetical protein BF49_6543 [Bradyrhizobium sp.]|nr:hypothetical protein BF49_6543 [Bradyrhizobium sp.]
MAIGSGERDLPHRPQQAKGLRVGPVIYARYGGIGKLDDRPASSRPCPGGSALRSKRRGATG